MDAKPWSFWFPDVMPHVPDCPTPIIEHELRRTAQDFLRRSRAWQAFIPALSVGATQETVTLDPSDDQAEISAIQEAWYDGLRIEVVPMESMAGRFGPDWNSASGTPTAVVPITSQVVRMYPIPTDYATTGLSLRVSLVPSHSAIGMPDDLANQYQNEIATGAKARLMLYPKRPWTDPDMAAVMHAQYEALLNSAISHVSHAGGKGRHASRPTWC
ncbi:MAG TPA: hypothetical protein PKD65_15795 [Nitrospira sp.]|nr:hypothetical protein [Rhodocyclaceae bacterium]HMW87487.1 hypothetical protein [Nitrospira sp.]HNF62837.1 hypothetical protein [Rhodocyclaceae bacterium]